MDIYCVLFASDIDLYALVVFQDECQRDLDGAQPALDAAIAALNILKPKDIALVKTMKHPPDRVKLVIEAACIMLGVKPVKIPNPKGVG